MNLSLADVGGAMLVVSQFTLLGDCRRGRRPDFTAAAPPEVAERLYQVFVDAVAQQGIPVATGRFRQQMEVELVNDGPVTLIVESGESGGNRTVRHKTRSDAFRVAAVTSASTATSQRCRDAVDQPRGGLLADAACAELAERLGPLRLVENHGRQHGQLRHRPEDSAPAVAEELHRRAERFFQPRPRVHSML